MSRFMSAIRRLSDNDFVQDGCAFMAMAAFLAFALWGAAGVCALVEAARLGL